MYCKLVNTAKTGLFLLSCLVYFYSCTSEPQGLELMEPVCFETQVLPLITSSCAVSGCHDAASGEEGYTFTTYEDILAAVKPGDARQSTLYKALTGKLEELMPPGQPISINNRNLIKIWIEQGALNTSCTNSGIPGQNNDSVCFTQDILPLLSSNCAKSGCHDAVTAEEGFILTSYSNITQNHDLVRPGNYLNSKLYEVLIEDGDDRMPPSPANSLTQDQINKIKKWISDGALNSSCVANCDTSGTVSFNSQIWPIIQNNCQGCHPASGSSNSINLGSYAQVKNVASTKRNGTSLLAGAIHQLNGFAAMPKNGKLDDCKISQVDKWINQGIVNN